MQRTHLGATITTNHLTTKVTTPDISRNRSHTEDNRSKQAKTIDHDHDHVHANAVTAATGEDNIIAITIAIPIVNHSLQAVINLITIIVDTKTTTIADTKITTIADTRITKIATAIATTDTSPITITLKVPTIDAPLAEIVTPAIALVIAIAIAVPIAMSVPRTSRSTTATTVVVRRAQTADQRMISPLALAKLDSP